METNAAFPSLPVELIEEILLRLPVQCLLRFKCVCRSWFSIISNPQFAKSHFDLGAAPTDRLLLKNTFNDESDSKSEIYFRDIEDDSSKVFFNIPNPPPTPIPRDGSGVDIVGSCRGFLLLHFQTRHFIFFKIWNPSMGIQKRLTIESPKLPYLCGIGYDSSTDDYVVVTVTFPLRQSGTEVHCFSSKTNSWSCTKYTVTYTVPIIHTLDDFGYGPFLKGALHWLVYSCDKHRKIIAFDVMEKRLSEISLPCELENQLYCLRVIRGCLCLCVQSYRNELPQLWMMKEYKVQSSWTKSFVYTPRCQYLRGFLPICFTKNGEILGHDARKILVRLNDKGKLPDHSGGLELVLSFLNRRFSVLYCGLHRESLLSLPGGYEKLTKRRSTTTDKKN